MFYLVVRGLGTTENGAGREEAGPRKQLIEAEPTGWVIERDRCPENR